MPARITIGAHVEQTDPIGEAVARLPAKVPRLRIWREPIRRTASSTIASTAAFASLTWALVVHGRTEVS